jgi:uncharacterized protein
VGAHRVRRVYRFRRRRATRVVAVVLALAAGAAAGVVTVQREPVAPGPDVTRQPVAWSRSRDVRRGERPVALTLEAHPPVVTTGAVTTLTVRLVDGDTGTPLAYRTVRLETLGPRGRRGVVELTTDAGGQAGIRRLLRSPVDVRASFAGTAHLAAPAPARARVRVTPLVRLRPAARQVPANALVTFAGQVRPAHPGAPVLLQRAQGDGWITVAHRSMGPDGSFAITTRPGTRPGRHVYRARAGGPGLDPGASSGLGVEVLPDAVTAAPVPTRAATPSAPLRLLVTGDSLAYWPGEQLRADRRAAPRMRTTVDSVHSTGLTRGDVFDWNRHADAQVARHDPEAVVLWLGGNDCQPMRTPAGRYAAVGTGLWQDEYRRRAVALMARYSVDRPRPVYWVGLPPAREPDIDGCFRAMSAATRRAVLQTRGATWLDTRPLYGGPGGRYTDTVAGLPARGSDGIHVNRAGSLLLTRRLLGLLAADWRVLG